MSNLIEEKSMLTQFYDTTGLIQEQHLRVFYIMEMILKSIKLTVHELRNVLILKNNVYSDIPKVGCPKTST